MRLRGDLVDEWSALSEVKQTKTCPHLYDFTSSVYQAEFSPMLLLIGNFMATGQQTEKRKTLYEIM
jgi:hypothetical protein